MDVSIIIVSWNVRDLLQACVQSVLAGVSNLSSEIFVIDNNSADGSAEMIRKKFPGVILIANTENMGFAYACNQALRRSSGHFVLLLNPDVAVERTSISDTIGFMLRTPKAGIVGCMLRNADGSLQSSVRRFPDLLSHTVMMLKLHNFFPNFAAIRHYYRWDWDYSKTGQVEQVMGAYFMIRRETLAAVGLLDQHFFLWYEEVDFCKRAQSAGWLTYYLSGVRVTHQKGTSFRQLQPLAKQLILNRGILHYFYKHSGCIAYGLLLLLYPISVLFASLVQLLHIKKKNASL